MSSHPARVLKNTARTAIHLIAALGELPMGWTSTGQSPDAVVPGAELSHHQGLMLLETAGDAQAIGRQGGALLAAATRRLMHLMRFSPGMALAQVGRRGAALCAAIPEPYRQEAMAWAQAAGCDPLQLLRSNAVADACCTALAMGARPQAGQPLLVGRNLDFFPAGALARATLVTLWRRDSALAVASVGWPGFNGVLSGMNAAGVCGMVLLNFSSRGPNHGAPIGYRVRAILEQATSCDAAIAAFAAEPVGSRHYLLLADPTQAAVVWQEDGVMRHHPMHDGWLSCSNGARGGDGQACDDRGRHLAAVRRRGVADEAWMRSAVSSTYLHGINAQAMVVCPERRELQLALGDAYHPAALGRWTGLELRAAFAGARLSQAPLTMLGRCAAQRHYSRAHRAASDSQSSAVA